MFVPPSSLLEPIREMRNLGSDIQSLQKRSDITSRLREDQRNDIRRYGSNLLKEKSDLKKRLREIEETLVILERLGFSSE